MNSLANGENATWYHHENQMITLKVIVQPGSKKNEVLGLHDEALKIKLTTPAIEGRANAALLKFIAQLFDVPKTYVTLKRGDKSRHKTIQIKNSRVRPEDILKRVNR